MKKRYYIVIAALLFGASVAKAQDHIKLDLQKTIQLANDSSLVAVCFVFCVSTRKTFVQKDGGIPLKVKFVIYILYQIILILLELL